MNNKKSVFGTVIAYSLKFAVAAVLFMFLQLPSEGFFGSAQASAQALVQSNSSYAQSTTTTSFSISTPSTNNLLIIVCTTGDNTNFNTPSGYTLATQNTGSPRVAIYYKVSVGTESTVSCITPGTVSDLAAHFFEYSGMATTGLVVGTGNASGNSANLTTGTATPSVAKSLLISGIHQEAGAADWAGGWSNSFVQQTTQCQCAGKPADRFRSATVSRSVTSIATYSSAVTSDSSAVWAGTIAAFRVYVPPLDTVSGTVYTDDGITTIGANKTVQIDVNGASADGGTAETDASGFFSVNVVQLTGALLTVYINDETEQATTITNYSGSTMTGINVYKNRLILRHETGATITNTMLDTGDNTGDADINYRVTGGSVTLSPHQGIYVWPNANYAPGGAVNTHDVKVEGTMAMSTNALTASGSIRTNAGTFTTAGTVHLTGLGDDSAPETITMGTNSFNHLIFNTGLIGYWRLDDGTGSTIARDSSILANNGTVAGTPTWDNGNTSSGTHFFNPFALNFGNSTANYITLPDNAVPTDNAKKLTMCGWTWHDDLSTNNYFFNDNNGGAGGLIFWNGVVGALSSRPNMYSFYVNSGAGNTRIESDANTAVLYTWTHVCGTFEASHATGLRLYLNGTEVSDSPVSTSTVANTGNNAELLRIAIAPAGDQPFGGLLDDLRIYNRVLSATEVAALANGEPASGSGYYVLGSTLDVNGNLEIYDSTLDVSASNYAINVAGNWVNNGNFIKRSGTVMLDGGAGITQTMSGNTIFHNFTKTVTTAASLFLDFRSQQTVSGSLTLRGTTSNLLSLRSTLSTSASNVLLDASAAQLIDFIDVKDNDASDGQELECFELSEGCIDSGNTFNWTFVDLSTTNLNTYFYWIE